MPRSTDSSSIAASPVTAQFTDSGGIFAGAQVTYRGIPVGKVGKLEFKDNGVRATLDIENSAPKISSDVLAVVANKSAIGEQFVDLQPRRQLRALSAQGLVDLASRTRVSRSTPRPCWSTPTTWSQSVNTDRPAHRRRRARSGLREHRPGPRDDPRHVVGVHPGGRRQHRRDACADPWLGHGPADTDRQAGRRSTRSPRTSRCSPTASSTPIQTCAGCSTRAVSARGHPAPGRRRELRPISARPSTTSSRPTSRCRRTCSASRRSSSSTPTWSRARSRCSTRCPRTARRLQRDLRPGPVRWHAPAAHLHLRTERSRRVGLSRASRGGRIISDRAFDTNLDCKVANNDIARQPSKTVLQAPFPCKAKLDRTAAASDESVSTGKDSWKWLLLGPANS